MAGWKDRAARGGMVAVEREEVHTQLTDSTKMSPVTLHVWIPWLSYITHMDLFLSLQSSQLYQVCCCLHRQTNLPFPYKGYSKVQHDEPLCGVWNSKHWGIHIAQVWLHLTTFMWVLYCITVNEDVYDIVNGEHPQSPHIRAVAIRFEVIRFIVPVQNATARGMLRQKIFQI